MHRRTTHELRKQGRHWAVTFLRLGRAAPCGTHDRYEVKPALKRGAASGASFTLREQISGVGFPLWYHRNLIEVVDAGHNLVIKNRSKLL